ncbi:cucumisin-like [Benincasa hispida]|uniref:cucumisin-like n=1 Tax=Benincasa hispida TaxID=102211 RepID=UPI0018FFC7E6|nr:cucumisin-like [Benincasa hispida]
MTRSTAMSFSLIFKLFLLSLFLSTLLASSLDSDDDGKKIYIVYMGKLKDDPDSAHLHHSSLPFAPESVVYTYKRSFNRFAVKLTKEEAKKIAMRIYHWWCRSSSGEEDCGGFYKVPGSRTTLQTRKSPPIPSFYFQTCYQT